MGLLAEVILEVEGRGLTAVRKKAHIDTGMAFLGYLQMIIRSVMTMIAIKYGVKASTHESARVASNAPLV